MRLSEKYFLKSILLCLLPAVLWLFINATANRHNHYILSGYVISHAHPYDKTPSNSDLPGSHHHNEAQLLLIGIISDPIATASIVLILWLFLLAVYRLFRITTDDPVLIRSFYQVFNYHAPPGQLPPPASIILF
jgi:4-amino-4-deoxy-L-arabinose transferase-like glycosyltransferase